MFYYALCVIILPAYLVLYVACTERLMPGIEVARITLQQWFFKTSEIYGTIEKKKSCEVHSYAELRYTSVKGSEGMCIDNAVRDKMQGNILQDVISNLSYVLQRLNLMINCMNTHRCHATGYRTYCIYEFAMCFDFFLAAVTMQINIIACVEGFSYTWKYMP